MLRSLILRDGWEPGGIAAKLQDHNYSEVTDAKRRVPGCTLILRVHCIAVSPGTLCMAHIALKKTRPFGSRWTML